MVGASLGLAGRCDLWGAQGEDSACGIFIMNFFHIASQNVSFDMVSRMAYPYFC